VTEFLGRAPRPRRDSALWVLSALYVTEVDEVMARRAARLLQQALDIGPGSDPSPIDALVAAEAERHAAVLVVDGDRDDFEALRSASDGFELLSLADVA